MHYRHHCHLMPYLAHVLAIILAITGMSLAHGEATIVINNIDPPELGFNDPEKRNPVGGNEGVTLGEQRLNVMKKAAELWGKLLDSSIEISVEASFSRLACDANSADLGGASPGWIIANFAGALQPNTWYPAALANALSAQDLRPGVPNIFAQFNIQLEGKLSCLGGLRWYYGFDHNSGRNIDFLNVVMHELAHGLGFASLTDERTGRFPGTGTMVFPSIYDWYVRDLTQNQTWAEMGSDAQRRVSAINTGNLVWSGPRANENLASLKAGTGPEGGILLYAPNPVQLGSSISHWDISLTPDALMEPFITRDLKSADGVDFTTCLLADIGWSLAENLQVNCLHGPKLTYAPASTLNFGSHSVGSPATEKLLVTSNGSADLKITAVAKDDVLVSPFSIAANNCANKTLPSGDSCEIGILFAPDADGSYEDSFEIKSNDPVAPNIVINVVGNMQP